MKKETAGRSGQERHRHKPNFPPLGERIIAG
jgi:hypothetical protein